MKKENRNNQKLYLVKVYGDVEPTIDGPFATEDARDGEATRFRRIEGDENGVYMLNIDSQGNPEIAAYSGGFMEGDDEQKEE